VGMLWKVSNVEVPEPPKVDVHVEGLAKGKEGKGGDSGGSSGGLDVGTAVTKGF